VIDFGNPERFRQRLADLIHEIDKLAQ
jgi:hypothetical protein